LFNYKADPEEKIGELKFTDYGFGYKKKNSDLTFTNSHQEEAYGKPYCAPEILILKELLDKD